MKNRIINKLLKMLFCGKKILFLHFNPKWRKIWWFFKVTVIKSQVYRCMLKNQSRYSVKEVELFYCDHRIKSGIFYRRGPTKKRERKKEKRKKISLEKLISSVLWKWRVTHFTHSTKTSPGVRHFLTFTSFYVAKSFRLALVFATVHEFALIGAIFLHLLTSRNISLYFMFLYKNEFTKSDSKFKM